MKNFTRNFTILCLVALAFAPPVHAQQNSIVQTSLSAAITVGQTKFAIASATGVNAPSFSSGLAGSLLFVQDVGQRGGEVMQVQAISSTTVTVSRGLKGTKASAHASGAMVLVATIPDWFYTTDPLGSCVLASTYASPYVNITNGNQWICSAKTLTWTPGWGNASSSGQALSATATASVAGATAIAGPFVEISGTNAITSFTMSTGWNGQNFCTYPTGAFTITATNNIAKAATAVADRALCFVYNSNSSKFSPQY